MSALNDADFGSDTDDDDYKPEGEVHDASEEENSGEDENTELEGGAVKTKKKKRGKAKKVANGRKNIFESDEDKVDWQGELEKEKQEKVEEKEKQKADDIWAAFKKDTSSNKPSAAKKSSSIASLFDTTPASKPEPAKPDASKSSNRLASLFDDIPKSTDKTGEPSKDEEKKKPKSLLSSLFDDDHSKATVEDESKDTVKPEPDTKDKGDKIEITKVFDFAGEMVTVSKEVDADSSEAKKFLKSQENSQDTSAAGTKRPGGLAGIVGAIGKKQKMGVLDKSKLDWNSFVMEEGISEELKTHNKGKDGFVEKQMFLERADLRQFEIEKSIRDKNRKSLMK